MPAPEQIYHGSVKVLSVVFVGLGVAILAITIARIVIVGGSPLSVGVLMGLGFVAVGAGRLWAMSRMSR